MKSLWPIFVLAVAWSIFPAGEAILSGQLLGHGLTDLYPSVWGLWAFAEAQPGLPNHTELLGQQGMGFYYSSPIKGWLAWPLIPLIGLTHTWNLLVILSRLATVVCSYGAARAWGFGQKGSLAAAAVYGCSPFFHGYAVEGIAEGTDGWTLALWVWAIGVQRFRLASIPFALAVLSSWYLGMVACLLAALALLWDRRIAWSGLGLLLVSPALAQFVSAFPANQPIDDAVRAAMGATLSIPTPGVSEGLNPFAKNTYVGFVVFSMALMSRTRWILAAGIPAFLSLGIGPIYDLPVAEMIRFPYRWHAATLVLLAPAVAITADRSRFGTLLALLIAFEGILLSPIEPVIPGARSDYPAYTRIIQYPVLEVPGPVAMPPGQENRSRARARYILYHQTAHGQTTPWVPDFNSVGVAKTETHPSIQSIRQLDPLVTRKPPKSTINLNGIPVGQVVIQHKRISTDRIEPLIRALKHQGWTREFEDSEAWVFTAPGLPE